jgi:hypothetical protein
MVERGFAQWLILGKTTVSRKELCPICANGDFKKNCQSCKRTGEVDVSYQIETLGTDIVLVTAGSANDDGALIYRPVLALKTPRVATIEKSHIEKAYVEGNKEEQQRIEEYGLLILQARIDMGIGITPPDDDYGRSPFARISDERTTLGIGKVGARITEGFKRNEEE